MIKRKYMKWLFVLYLLILLKVIVFKYPPAQLRAIADTWSRDVFLEGLSGANFTLFRTIKMYIRHWDMRGINSFGNLIGNVVAFIPLGYFLPRLFQPMRNVFACLLASLLFILGIELFQLVSAFGVFDVDDILLNGLGALVGFGIFHITYKLWKRKGRIKLR